VSNASSIVVAGANTQLAITFNAGSATTGIVTGTVTASLTAGTYTSAESYASEVSRAVKAALLAAGTAAVQGLADSVNVTSASVTGGGAALTLDIGGLATGQTFTTAGGATAAGAATGWTAMTTAEVTGSGGNFQVGANAGDIINLSLGSTNMASLGLSTISLTGTDAAISATIAALDSAVNTISTQRGSIGALQNRFESMIQNLQVTTENLAASESRIRDTDMAAEMVEFTKNQVLSQAGTAMLAQANQIPQGILSLLKG
jgi:flagellin